MFIPQIGVSQHILTDWRKFCLGCTSTISFSQARPVHSATEVKWVSSRGSDHARPESRCGRTPRWIDRSEGDGKLVAQAHYSTNAPRRSRSTRLSSQVREHTLLYFSNRSNPKGAIESSILDRFAYVFAGDIVARFQVGNRARHF